MTPVLRSVLRPIAVPTADVVEVHDQQAGESELRVAPRHRAGHHRRTEDVDEQQGEEDRLDGHIGQLHGIAAHVDEVAARHCDGGRRPTRSGQTPEEGGRRAPVSALSGHHARASWAGTSSTLGTRRHGRPGPRWRHGEDTSSSDGRCTVMSSTSTPASSSARSAATASPGRCRAGVQRRRPSLAIVTEPTLNRPSASAAPACGAASVTSARAATRRLELVRGATRDHPAVVDDHDVVGEGVRLIEVLRREEHRGAVVGRARGSRPTCAAGWWGRAPSSARRGTTPAAASRDSRPGRGAGTCRRSSP